MFLCLVHVQIHLFVFRSFMNSFIILAFTNVFINTDFRLFDRFWHWFGFGTICDGNEGRHRVNSKIGETLQVNFSERIEKQIA